MSKFAKVFEIPEADTQLLVWLTTDDDKGHPQVKLITELYEDAVISVGPIYGKNDWDKAERYFNSIGQAEAEQIHAGITSIGRRA